MTTALKAPKLFTVRYEITGNEVEDCEPWNIYSPDGEFEACRETREEAEAHARECNESLILDTAAEEEAEREELVGLLQGKIEEMDLKALRKLAKRLLD